MIKTKILQDGKLIRHYSDNPEMDLLQEDTGIIYTEAVDINPTQHIYKEIKSENPESMDIEAKAQAYDIITGREE